MPLLKNKNVFLILISVFILASSCRVNKSINRPFVSYYKSENTLIYFIKPKKLVSENKSSIDVDFTFTDNLAPDSVTVNFTLKRGKELVKPSFNVIIDSAIIPLKINDIIFKEIVRKNVSVRYSSYISKKELLKIIKAKNFSIQSYSNNVVADFYKLINKEMSKMEEINFSLYEILESKF
jgi:hypothetical protein